MSTSEGIANIFSEVDSHFAHLDVLINNAAQAYQSITEGNYEEWEYIVKTNLLGYLACSNRAIDKMRARKAGHIINIGSMSADVREKGSSVYVATKSGIQGFSESLRKEVNESGIKVTLIEPGAVGTDMQPSTPEEQREKEKNLEMLKAEDIAYSVVYCLAQAPRCDVVELKIRPHLQMI
jgi:NADP-dependent 3-hydroxy acid dehydrogenase YdfG